jgi:hypothetical protein
MRDEIRHSVIGAARLFLQKKVFRQAAREAAEGCGPEDWRELLERFDAPPALLRGEGDPERRAVWASNWKHTLAEVSYQGRERALSVLREYAFEAAQPGQPAAFNAYCRLAAEGVEPEQFFADLVRGFPALPSPPHPDRLFIVENLRGYEAVPERYLERHRWESLVLPETVWRLGPSTPEFRAEVGRLWRLPEFDQAREVFSRLQEELAEDDD